MEAAPSAALVVSKPDFLFEVLVVALDPPAQFGKIDQTFEGDVVNEIREPIFGRLVFLWRPLDQQPFLGAALGHAIIATGGSDSHAGKARAQPISRAFAPTDCAPSMTGQS